MQPFFHTVHKSACEMATCIQIVQSLMSDAMGNIFTFSEGGSIAGQSLASHWQLVNALKKAQIVLLFISLPLARML
jgi:hypothetical protein